MQTLINLLITAASVVIITYILPGVSVDNFMTAFIVAIVLGLLRIFVKPILVIFTLPATILSLGLFLFVINACIILIANEFVYGFNVDNFFWAFLFSILLSIVQSLLHKVIGTEK